MKPTKVKLSSLDTPCSIDYFVVAGKTAKRKEWLAKHELYEAETNFGKRIVTPVTIHDESEDESEDKIYMMDAVTGSLYDKSTGRCLTSSVVYMTKIVPRKGLADKLFKMKADDS
jgi:hypothetical protein